MQALVAGPDKVLSAKAIIGQNVETAKGAAFGQPQKLWPRSVLAQSSFSTLMRWAESHLTAAI